MAIAVGGAQGRLGVGDLLLGGGSLLLRGRQALDERALRRLGRPPPRRAAGSASASSRASFSSRVARRAVARSSSCAPRSTPERSAASSPRLSAARPVRAGTPSAQSRSKAARASASAPSARASSSRCGASAAASASASASSARQAGGLGLEGGDHGLVDEGAALAVDPAPALGEHGRQAARLLAERLEAHQRVAEVVAAGVAELGLGGEHRGVELGEGAAQEVVLGGQLGAGGGAVGQAPGEGGELAPGEEHLQRAQLGDEVAVAAGGVGLALERAELAAHLAQEVAEPGEVALGGGEPALGLLLALAVLQDAGRLLDDEAAVLGPGVEHGVDLALADDHVLLPADAGVGEQLLDVEQPARHAVDGVLAVAGAEQRAGDRDLGELDRAGGPAELSIVSGDLGATERRALRRAGEDDVVHLLRAHRRRRLRAEHPADGVDDVRLARPVRPHHDGDARLQLQCGGVGEGLEALQRERLQEHPRANLVGPELARRAPSEWLTRALP